MSSEPSPPDFGVVDEIDVEAIGEPGQRTFRVLVERGPDTACLWVEKEQLQALGLILQQQMTQFGRRRSRGEGAVLTLAARFPPRPTVDFKVGRLAVGFDPDRRNFVITAHSVDAVSGGDPTFVCRASRAQVRALTGKIAEVIAAGRPRCPLCGEPVEGTHVCPLANGHVRE